MALLQGGDVPGACPVRGGHPVPLAAGSVARCRRAAPSGLALWGRSGRAGGTSSSHLRRPGRPERGEVPQLGHPARPGCGHLRRRALLGARGAAPPGARGRAGRAGPRGCSSRGLGEGGQHGTAGGDIGQALGEGRRDAVQEGAHPRRGAGPQHPRTDLRRQPGRCSARRGPALLSASTRSTASATAAPLGCRARSSASRPALTREYALH